MTRKILSQLLAIALLIIFSFNLSAQEAYNIEDKTVIEVTSVKNQHRSGTCWSFSGLALLEAELMRMGKAQYDLAEMFVVRMSYYDKAIKYVRFHGHLNFAGGGAFHDVTNTWKNYGMLPEAAYPGLEYGQDKHMHGELDNVLKAYVDAVIENKNKELSTAWIKGLKGILDAYLGEVPENFEYDGKTYTIDSFTKELGLNMDDYLGLTSFTHHPFYSSFIIEIPDNWAYESSYNLPIDEFMQCLDYAIENGYTVAWGADVSEKGFSWKNGLAIVPEKKLEDLSGTEREKWEKLTEAERQKMLYSFEEIVPEMEITQEMRQTAFDNYTTTDDHGMLITGIAYDQNGTKYYKVKNSWDAIGKYDGYFYASEAFVKYKTINFVLHKDAIPKAIAKKLKL
jgi:bleomycin hydrolase